MPPHAACAQGEEPARRQRVGSWAPVIPAIPVPSVAGGDTPGDVALDVAAALLQDSAGP